MCTTNITCGKKIQFNQGLETIFKIRNGRSITTQEKDWRLKLRNSQK